jgi:hypothetical protein
MIDVNALINQLKIAEKWVKLKEWVAEEIDGWKNNDDYEASTRDFAGIFEQVLDKMEKLEKEKD